MFNQIMVLWAYAHLFDNIALAHVMTAVLIITVTSFQFLVCFAKKYVCED